MPLPPCVVCPPPKTKLPKALSILHLSQSVSLLAAHSTSAEYHPCPGTVHHFQTLRRGMLGPEFALSPGLVADLLFSRGDSASIIWWMTEDTGI